MSKQLKPVMAVSALILSVVLALTNPAQAAPKKHVPVAMQRASIIAERFPAIYDGPKYGGPITKAKGVQLQKQLHQQIRVPRNKSGYTKPRIDDFHLQRYRVAIEQVPVLNECGLLEPQ